MHLDALDQHEQQEFVWPRPDWPIWNRTTLMMSVQIEKF
jgi:hypothetical protein